MFIKKDLRKVEEILVDPSDRRESLKLSKRPAEFQGSLQVLCRETRLAALQNLRELNLYENDLTSLKGIGLLAKSPIEDINLGYNKITTIPVEVRFQCCNLRVETCSPLIYVPLPLLQFGTLSTLRTLWLDDNQLEQFPICLCQLTGLRSLRLTGNDLETLPASISALQDLHTLAVDNNRLRDFPAGCLRMPKLKHLWLRQNKIVGLPESLASMSSLETLSVSSNALQALPPSLASMPTLQKVYANGNKIQDVSDDWCRLVSLVELNLANNDIERIPADWKAVWGDYDATVGEYKKSATCKVRVTLRGNPLSAE